MARSRESTWLFAQSHVPLGFKTKGPVLFASKPAGPFQTDSTWFFAQIPVLLRRRPKSPGLFAPSSIHWPTQGSSCCHSGQTVRDFLKFRTVGPELKKSRLVFWRKWKSRTLRHEAKWGYTLRPVIKKSRTLWNDQKGLRAKGYETFMQGSINTHRRDSGTPSRCSNTRIFEEKHMRVLLCILPCCRKGVLGEGD